jgi:hypothetical protein
LLCQGHQLQQLLWHLRQRTSAADGATEFATAGVDFGVVAVGANGLRFFIYGEIYGEIGDGLVVLVVISLGDL